MDESAGMGAASRAKSNCFVARALPWIMRKREFPTTSFGVTRGPRSTVEEAAGPPHMWTVHGYSSSPILNKPGEPACARARFVAPAKRKRSTAPRLISNEISTLSRRVQFASRDLCSRRVVSQPDHDGAPRLRVRQVQILCSFSSPHGHQPPRRSLSTTVRRREPLERDCRTGVRYPRHLSGECVEYTTPAAIRKHAVNTV